MTTELETIAVVSLFIALATMFFSFGKLAKPQHSKGLLKQEARKHP